MGTEQQQEFKSEKPLPKPQRKTIPFTDNSIENWKPKNLREQRGFPRTNTTNGLKILARKNLKDKYWKLEYHLNKKKLSLALGPFIPGVRGTEAITKEMLKLISSHKDLRRTHWLTDPKKTIKEKDQKVVIEAQQKEEEIKRKEDIKRSNVSINNVIESLCVAGFPKVKIKDEFLSKISIRTHANFLIGNNQRGKHLSYSEDSEGNGKIFFKPGGPQSFPELFQKYPSGVGPHILVPTRFVLQTVSS